LGQLSRTEEAYAFIRKDGDGSVVYARRADDTRAAAWVDLRAHLRMSFELAFNYRGPVALDVKREM
jgi:hypothetical protein